MGQITRMTFFKLPSAADQDAALAAYATMNGKNLKDGKPYILSQDVKKLIPDPRSGGFTIMAKSVFSSVEDMKHYDDTDEAHTELKNALRPKVEGGKAGVMMVYMES